MRRNASGTAGGAGTEKLLADLEPILAKGGDPELKAIEAAIYIEESFGVVLDDAEIGPERLGSVEAARRLLEPGREP